MKNYTKVLAVALSVSTVMSMAGCSLFNSSKLAPKNLSSYASSQDAEFYEDIDDFTDLMDELNDASSQDDAMKKIKDGVYINLEGKDVKTYFKNSNFGGTTYSVFEYDKTMTSATVYYLGNSKSEKKTMFSALAIEFETAEDAEEYFENCSEGVEDGFGQLGELMDTDTDDGEENNIAYFLGAATYGSTTSVYEGLYQQGRYVLIVMSADINGTSKGEDKIIEFCEEFGLADPTDF